MHPEPRELFEIYYLVFFLWFFAFFCIISLVLGSSVLGSFHPSQ